MATPGSGPIRRATFTDLLVWTIGGAWTLLMACAFVVAEREHRSVVFGARDECGSDPRDILRPGETLDRFTLRFIVHAHCSNARYPSDERIELSYGGGGVVVETRRLSIGKATYYKILSVGEEAEGD